MKTPHPTDATRAGPARRAFLLGALGLTLRPATAASRQPRLLAGYLAGAIEPGGGMERQVLDLLPAQATADIHWMPWARALATAAAGHSLLFPLTRTPEREAAWQWLAPLARDRTVLVLPRGQAPAALAQLRVGTVRSAFLVERLTAQGCRHIEIAPNERANAQKLAWGRIDAWATVASVAAATAAQGRLPAGARILPLDPAWFTMWLAASPDVELARLAQAPRLARPWSGTLPGVFDARG